jgi:hypothetical protein
VPLTFFLADLLWRFFENPLIHLRESGGIVRHAWNNPRAIGEAFTAPILDLRQKAGV